MMSGVDRANALHNVARAAKEIRDIERTLADKRTLLESHVADATIAGFPLTTVRLVSELSTQKLAALRTRGMERRSPRPRPRG